MYCPVMQGLGVNLSHLPSTSPPPPQPYSTPVAATLPESRALSQRIEAWFGKQWYSSINIDSESFKCVEKVNRGLTLHRICDQKPPQNGPLFLLI